jgi:DNA replication protein DnaC
LVSTSPARNNRDAARTRPYERLLTRLLKVDLLAIDDWLVAPLRDAERRDLLSYRDKF